MLSYGRFPIKNLRWILEGLCSIVDGLLMIVSLGFYNSSFRISFIEWTVHLRFRLMKNDRKRINFDGLSKIKRKYFW